LNNLTEIPFELRRDNEHRSAVEPWNAANLGSDQASIAGAPEPHSAHVGGLIFDRARRTGNSNLDLLPICSAQGRASAYWFVSMRPFRADSNKPSAGTDFDCEGEAAFAQALKKKTV
jgi:LAS superfamily LD-carboxypeptidase LdcB